jgi:hypothetical protein
MIPRSGVTELLRDHARLATSYGIEMPTTPTTPTPASPAVESVQSVVAVELREMCL